MLSFLPAMGNLLKKFLVAFTYRAGNGITCQNNSIFIKFPRNFIFVIGKFAKSGDKVFLRRPTNQHLMATPAGK